MASSEIFIITAEYMDKRSGHEIRIYGKSEQDGAVEAVIDYSLPVFFVERSSEVKLPGIQFKRKPVDMKSFSMEELDAIYFRAQRDLTAAAETLRAARVHTYEADIDPVRRFLMERFINCQMFVEGEAERKGKTLFYKNPKIRAVEVTPKFSVLSLDIETSGDGRTLFSIAVHMQNNSAEEKKVFILGAAPEGSPDYLFFYADEKKLLAAFNNWLQEADPDVIIGWHVIGFDLMFLEKKYREYNLGFELGRNHNRAIVKERKTGSGYYAFIPGRVVIDGPFALRSSFYSFEDFALETVSQELLGKGKLLESEKEKVEEIEYNFHHDKIKLAEYNLQDAVLVSEIFAKTGLLDLSIKRGQLSGMLLDQLGSMTAAFDHFMLPRLHREGYVANNLMDIPEGQYAPGGYVLDPKAGLYDNVGLFDFKSLYPSIMRTFKIDPLSRLLSDEDTITTPGGYKFSRTRNFLPNFIGYLMELRAEAKEKNDKHLAQAIKILMNSFYGVMGSFGCRFYHPTLPTAITNSGQWFMIESKKFLEKKGYEILYGDTDSLFVKLLPGEELDADKAGAEIASSLNGYLKKRLSDEFNAESYLEIEYERYYKKFAVTNSRNGETGAKKRYAGLQVKGGKEEIGFTGMEAVRSDWTKLAKDFQYELYDRLFYNKEIDEWLRAYCRDIQSGKYDSKLIYKKRLRKELDSYTKNVPPHAKAAKMINRTYGSIEYVITRRGPIPIELPHKDIDHEHYIDKQIKPIADSALALIGKSFDQIVKENQFEMF